MAFIAIALFCCQKINHSRSLIIMLKQSAAFDSASSQELRKNKKKSTTSKFQEIYKQMARVRSTARVGREGDETEATETVPISEAM
jgi:hypothetical protein